MDVMVDVDSTQYELISIDRSQLVKEIKEGNYSFCTTRSGQGTPESCICNKFCEILLRGEDFLFG